VGVEGPQFACAALAPDNRRSLDDPVGPQQYRRGDAEPEARRNQAASFDERLLQATGRLTGFL
jgi:hypothetical protein